MKTILLIGLLALTAGILMAAFGETGRIQLIAGGLTPIGIIMIIVAWVLRRNARVSSQS